MLVKRLYLSVSVCTDCRKYVHRLYVTLWAEAKKSIVRTKLFFEHLVLIVFLYLTRDSFFWIVGLISCWCRKIFFSWYSLYWQLMNIYLHKFGKVCFSWSLLGILKYSWNILHLCFLKKQSFSVFLQSLLVSLAGFWSTSYLQVAILALLFSLPPGGSRLVEWLQ